METRTQTRRAVDQHAENVARAARGAGSRVERTWSYDGRAAWKVVCPSHRHKVRLLANLAELDAQTDPRLRELAVAVASDKRGRRATIAALQQLVQETVAHWGEGAETFSPSWETLDSGIGDCDDSARALLALLRSLGVKAGLATLYDPPRHVAVVVHLDGGWKWAEASIAAQLGEHPAAAHRRLRTRKGL